jgi:hypothetical protein
MPAKKDQIAGGKPTQPISVDLDQPAAALAVAGYPQDDRDDRIGHRSNRLGYDVETEAHLRVNHRQDEKNPDQDHRAARPLETLLYHFHIRVTWLCRGTR